MCCTSAEHYCAYTPCQLRTNVALVLTTLRRACCWSFGLATTSYLTRVQQERFGTDRQDEYERLKHHYVLKPEHMESAKENMAIMHPLPRVGEIDPRVDEDPRAAYFRQVEDSKGRALAVE